MLQKMNKLKKNKILIIIIIINKWKLKRFETTKNNNFRLEDNG